MFNYPDLARVHCDRLSLVFHIELPRRFADGILEASHKHHGPGFKPRVFYGNNYKVAGVHYASEATMFPHKADEHHVDISFVREKRSKPPKNWKPVGDLITPIIKKVGRTSTGITCQATFVYRKRDGWTSKIRLPLEFRKRPSSKSKGVFTHLDGIRLSVRKDNDVTQWLRITVTERGDIQHIVYMEEKLDLTTDTARAVLEKLSKVSEAFIAGKEG